VAAGLNKISALGKTDRTGVDEPDGMSGVNELKFF